MEETIIVVTEKPFLGTWRSSIPRCRWLRALLGRNLFGVLVRRSAFGRSAVRPLLGVVRCWPVHHDSAVRETSIIAMSCSLHLDIRTKSAFVNPGPNPKTGYQSEGVINLFKWKWCSRTGWWHGSSPTFRACHVNCTCFALWLQTLSFILSETLHHKFLIVWIDAPLLHYF
jgi:hypothetical protein